MGVGFRSSSQIWRFRKVREGSASWRNEGVYKVAYSPCRASSLGVQGPGVLGSCRGLRLCLRFDAAGVRVSKLGLPGFVDSSGI